MNDKIAEIYYDPEQGFLSAPKLYQKLKENGVNVTMKQVVDWLKKQETQQVLHQKKKPTLYNTIQGYSPRGNYQLDIIVYDRYTINHYCRIMVVVDVYSRYCTARALTNSKESTIESNLDSIFKEMGVCQRLNCDNEFNTKRLNEYFSEHKIKVYYSDPNEINKNAIVERLNRTIALRLQKWRVASGRHDWYAVLPAIIKGINNSYHRTIKAKPVDVWTGKALNRQQQITLEDSFPIGQKVRIKEYHKTFDKGDLLTYSKDVYKITEKVKGRYRLQGQERLYKPYELKPVEEIQINPKYKKEVEQEEEHKKTQKTRRVKRMMNKEGVNEEENITVRPKRPKREWKPRIMDQWEY